MSAQLALTAIVAATIMFNAPVQRFVMGSIAFQITCAVLPLVGEHLLPRSRDSALVCLCSLVFLKIANHAQVSSHCLCTRGNTRTT